MQLDDRSGKLSRRMQLNDRCGQPRSVESLNAAGRSSC